MSKANPFEPDLVDAIFEYLLREFPEVSGLDLEALKRLTRDEFGGDKSYVRRSQPADAKQRVLLGKVLAHFNGRNASEVARRLGIGRATVYRLLKQARGESLTASRDLRQPPR